MNYYSEKIEDVLKNLDTTLNGLSNEEASIRLKMYGENILPKKKVKSIPYIFLMQLKSPIIYILLITMVISFFIGEYIDGIFILLVIVLDAAMGTYQEYKATKSSMALQNMIKIDTSVLRDNKKIVLDSANLVKGDIVYLNSGDKVGADIRIIESLNLFVDESVLTGESIVSSKNNKIIKDEVVLADMSNMLFAGTSVTSGRAVGVVVETGINTEVGKIASFVSNEPDAPSPLTIRMEKFTKELGILTIIISVILTIVMYFKGYEIKDIFLSVVALAISAIPEGLPVAITLCLSVASGRMGKKGVIVKKLNSVESLGSCTVIASDKTGTLTLNEQTAKIIKLPNNHEYEITGSGYNDIGRIEYDKDEDLIKRIALYGAINNEATLIKENDEFTYSGDSIDVAFLSLAYKANVMNEKFNTNVISIIPYESENKYSSVLFKEEELYKCTIKGSIEKVLSFCKIDEEEKEKLLKQNEKLACDGYRVIALAVGIFDSNLEFNEKNIKNLEFMGLVGFIDPIRSDVAKSISTCKKSGINVLMITGDHPLTAYNIALDLKLVKDYSEVVTSSELANAYNNGTKYFDEYIKNKKVFTRVTPEQKLLIVESFKRMGEFVAVTGDGVNDALALKSANIGIAMGSGTDVAKETASMIICDDKFSSIVTGIEEGRLAYSNIRKVVYMLLSCAISEILFFALAVIIDMPIPFVAIQLLWLNLVTDGIQDSILTLESDTEKLMDDKPRSTGESIFDKVLVREILVSGLFISIVICVAWYYLIKVLNMDLSLARGYVLLLMVFLQNLHTLNCRSENKSIFKMKFKTNPYVIIGISLTIILQFVVSFNEKLSNILGVSKISIDKILLLFLMAIPIIIVGELLKLINRKSKK